MNLNPIFLIKIVITSILFLFSAYLFYSGYIEISNSILQFNNKMSTTSMISNIKENKIENEIIENYNLKNENKLYDIQPNIIENINEKKISIIVEKNDTFSKIIDPFYKNKSDKHKIINLIQTKYDLKYLNIGQKIFLYINESQEISKIILPIDFFTELIVEKIDKKNYSIKEIKVKISEELISSKFKIEKSLYQDGLKKEIPVNILSEIIKLYSYDIDFQRDIKKGNQLEILYKLFYNEERNTLSYGKIYYTNLSLQKSNLEYFLFKTREGYYDYFNSKGKNVKKALMKTPIDGARLSSSFGMRKHPILGYNKLHKGLDFAAPTGTPVYSAGNGVIEVFGRNGGYGKYIRIRHNNSYKTAYAHLNGFKKNLGVGVRVSQGDIIGYVGSTGKSTGPHLHYEIIYKNKQINPMKMKLPPNKELTGEEFEIFLKNSRLIFSNYLYNLYE